MLSIMKDKTMATNNGWKKAQPRLLKKVVYGMNKHTLNQLIVDHESRGWSIASEIKEYNYGLGCLMVFKNNRFNSSQNQF